MSDDKTPARGLLMRRRTVLRVGALTSLAVVGQSVLAACTPGTSTPPAADKTAPPTEKLTIIQDNAIDSMDAHVAQRSQANTIIGRINEPLVDRDPQTLQPRARLAVSWRRVDPLVWEFKLRPGVKFTSGEPFNAAVVKFNFDRAMNPDLKSAKGSSFRTVLDATTPVTAVDDTTVRFKTRAPYALLLERLTPFWMVPQSYSPDAPVGTGPYTFGEWLQGQSVTIKRNPDYWGTKGTYETILYRQITESATAVAELLAGTADIAFGVTPDQRSAVTATGKHDVLSTEEVSVVEIRMDPLARGGPNPFTDKRVRQAAAYAIDKESIAKNLLGGYSQVVATNIVPKMFGHDPNVKPYPHDPAKARQLLAQAGHPNGFEVRFLSFPVSGFAPSILTQVVEAVVSDLGKVGIKANIFQVGATEVSQYTTTGKAGPIFIGGNPNGGFYDGGFAFFFLRKQFTSSYFWSDQLESMIVQVEQDTDNDARKRVLSQIQQYLHEEAPYIWGWTGFHLLGVSKQLDLTDVRVGPDFLAERIKPKA